MSAFNRLTAALNYFGPWAFMLTWEVVALILRAMGYRVGTISMVARDMGWHAVFIPFLWGGMASHWWWPAAKFAHPALGVAFWALAVALFAWDVASWGAPVTGSWLRFPFAWCVVGFVAGGLLFPQVGLAPWRTTK